MVQFTWKSMGPKLRRAFQKGGDTLFSDVIGSIIFGKEATKHNFNVARTLATLRYRHFKGTLPGDVIAPELMGHVALPFQWKAFILVSSRMLIQREINPRSRTRRKWRRKQSRATKLCSSLHQIPEKMRLKKNSMVTCPSQEKLTKRASGNTLRTPSTGSMSAKAQEKGLKFWQTRSHATTTIQCGLIASRKRYPRMETKLCIKTLSTPRPAPRMNLKQQQQQQDTLRNTRTPAAEQHQVTRSSDSKWWTGTSVAEEEKSPKIVLRSQGVSRDAVLEDEERMPKKFKTWLTNWELDTQPSRSYPIWGRNENSPGSAKHQIVQLDNWEMLNCMSLERFPRPFNAERLETRTRGITLLSMWCCLMPSLAGTETKDQNSIRDHVCSILHSEGGPLTRSETRRKPVAGRPLEGKRRKTQCNKEKPWFHRAPRQNDEKYRIS